jgi:hypothetical protein
MRPGSLAPSVAYQGDVDNDDANDLALNYDDPEVAHEPPPVPCEEPAVAVAAAAAAAVEAPVILDSDGDVVMS